MVEKIKAWLYGIKPDKLLHFIAGLIVAQMAFALANIWLDKWLALCLAVFASMLAGGLKELIDTKIGVPNWSDVIATIIGGVVGTILILLI